MSDTYGSQPPAGPPQAAPTDLASQWKGWMDDPGNKAALIQFGLALSQPTALGQNTMGHVGQAIGAGGEASDRVTAQEMADAEQARKQSESDSKATAREASASNAETRANAASVRAQSDSAQVESRIALRKAQALAAESRSGQLDANVRLLEQRIAQFPDDAAARLELVQARSMKAQADTDLSLARAGVVERETATREKRAETSANLGQQRVDTAKDKVAATREGFGLGASVRDRSAYDRFVAQTKANDTNASLLDRNYKPTVIPGFQEWRASRGATENSVTPVPTPSAAPASSAPSTVREGATATGPNGEKKVYRSGKWVDM